MTPVFNVLISVLIFVVNVGNHGNASVDNLLSTSSKVLLEDNIKISDIKSCHRPCKFNVKPKQCHFKFNVNPSLQEDGKIALTINNQTPGPAIHVCVNDIIIVEVINKIPDQDLALHWHGISQRGTPYMDGVPMITQCPISFGMTYKYAFRASSAGTFFYHAHSATHQSDGVYGSLVVSQPAPLDHHSTLYDYDRTNEHTLLLAATFPKLLTAHLEDLSQIHPDGLIINGLPDSYKLFVTEGYNYRLRLINAVAVECPLAVTADDHELIALASDGKPVKAIAGKKMMLYPGERMDVVLKAGQAVGGYWLRVTGHGACAGLQAKAVIVYSGFNHTSMAPIKNHVKDVKKHQEDLLQQFQEPYISGQMLRSTTDLPFDGIVKQIYLGIDRNTVAFGDSDNDYRYIGDAVPKPSFYPAQLSLNDGKAVQINKKNFLYPNAPILTQRKDVKLDITCKVGNEEHKDVQCLHKLEGTPDTVIEIVLANEGAGSNDSYTFHLHGLSMFVVGSGQLAGGPSLTRKDFEKWDTEGKVSRNTLDPPLKDTVTVPNKGYVIVRVLLENGSWLLECRACSLSSLPVAILIDVPQQIPKTVTDALPKCGNFRPPDVLLN